MSRRKSPFSDLQQPARQAAAQPWVEQLARCGYAAKGFVYLIVGLLAAQAAFTTGGKTTDTNGALETILGQPFGKFLLALVAIGLIGYALWRVVQTVFDPEHAGEAMKAKQIVQRVGYAFSASAYIGLALTAVKLIMGTETGNSNGTQDWTARLLAQPWGRGLVCLGGLVVIGVGLSYLYQAYKADFQRHFQRHQMSETERKWAKWLGAIWDCSTRHCVWHHWTLFHSCCFAEQRQQSDRVRWCPECVSTATLWCLVVRHRCARINCLQLLLLD
jgi:hypothetical protein